MSASLLAAAGNLSWRTASRCDVGNCVRVAPYEQMIVIGDTKNPDGPVFASSHEEWRVFVARVRRGEFR